MQKKVHEKMKNKFPNGCDESVPAALRYLARNPRPTGGQELYNSEHLYQLADEIEDAVRNNYEYGKYLISALKLAIEALDTNKDISDQIIDRVHPQIKKERIALHACEAALKSL